VLAPVVVLQVCAFAGCPWPGASADLLVVCGAQKETCGKGLPPFTRSHTRTDTYRQRDLVLQVICRIADYVALPSRMELEGFYGGRRRLPEHPWGDYYFKVVLSAAPYSPDAAWLQGGEAAFEKSLEPDEVGRITAAQVCSNAPLCHMLCHHID
jgi:hypothetical protein